MENMISTIAMASIIGASICMGMGSIGPALGEGNAAVAAIKGMAQQPDESSNLRSTMFVAMAMIESTAIYSLLISMILIFANPFWSFATEQFVK